MYQGGKLLFADYIFDGYGSTKKDLLRQVCLKFFCSLGLVFRVGPSDKNLRYG